MYDEMLTDLTGKWVDGSSVKRCPILEGNEYGSTSVETFVDSGVKLLFSLRHLPKSQTLGADRASSYVKRFYLLHLEIMVSKGKGKAKGREYDGLLRGLYSNQVIHNSTPEPFIFQESLFSEEDQPEKEIFSSYWQCEFSHNRQAGV